MKDKMNTILSYVESLFKESHTALCYKSPFELLISAILSAQCTDERVNKVTPSLFNKYKKVDNFANADISELEKDIFSTGFYKNKARNIIELSKMLIDKFGGKVPQTMEELTQLPGVGRKTANLILGECFGIPGIIVDTHVSRVSKRLELTESDDPEKIEKDLMALIPEEKWTISSMKLLLFGRHICQAKKPKCNECGLRKICGYYRNIYDK